MLEQATWRTLLSSPETALTTPSLRRRRAANQAHFSEKAVQVDSALPVPADLCDKPFSTDRLTALNSDRTTWLVGEHEKFTQAASPAAFFSRLRPTPAFVANPIFAANDTFHTAHCESSATPQPNSNKTAAYSSLSFIDTLQFLNFLVRRYFFSKSKLRRSARRSAMNDTNPAPNFFAQMGVSQNDAEEAMTVLEKKVKTALEVVY